jgi:hypothetical protein
MDDFVVLTRTEQDGLVYELGVRHGAAMEQAVINDQADFTFLPVEVRISKSAGKHQARPA